MRRELAKLIAVQFVGLLGFALFLWGVYQVHRAAAFIVGGLLLVIWATLKSAPRGSVG